MTTRAALEAEVTEFLGRERYERGDRARAGSRNGHAPVTVKTTVGPVILERPKVRGADEAFASRLLGKHVTPTNALESLTIAGYVRGLSTRVNVIGRLPGPPACRWCDPLFVFTGEAARGRPGRKEGHMRYMLLYYGEEPAEQPSEDEVDAEMAEWSTYDGAIKKAGIHLAGDALQPSQTATTVRVRGDERIVTDGPFAETREVLGGFDVIDVTDLDTAVDCAARCPAAKQGTVEVRPIMELEASPR